MFTLPVIPCCPCPCSEQGNVTIVINGGGSGGSGSGCSLQGSVRPEGSVVASPGCWYRYEATVDDVYEYEVWYKDTGTLTPYGWYLHYKLA